MVRVPGARARTRPPRRRPRRGGAHRRHGPGRGVPAGRTAQPLRAITDFVGRTAEVATLRALLTAPDRHSLPLAAVSGMGGIGKTALVLHVAHLVREHYPDGQLYAGLRGMDPDPEDPAIVLGAFLDGLGCPPAGQPDAPADQAGRSRPCAARPRTPGSSGSCAARARTCVTSRCWPTAPRSANALGGAWPSATKRPTSGGS
ncbi:ATP-binding protein [Streptomyces sp. CB00455]|uniref:ATP-binding protein n=1 Tax=Streptomyces sp. CB00455 TaxID=1703927 RepID=UPI00093A7897|nr:ATP-binding protein [Streptomyces sp. CB00455]